MKGNPPCTTMTIYIDMTSMQEMEALQSQTRTDLSHFQFSNRLLIVLNLQLKLPAKD